MSDSNLGTDVIRSLLSELINKINETKGDKNIQKQNDSIISALKELSDNIKDNKIDTEKLVKNISEKIAEKINPVIKETSDSEIKTIKEENNEVVHSGNGGNNGNGGNGGNNNSINPDATEPSKKAEDEAKKLSNSFSRVNLKTVAFEAALGGAAMVVEEGRKGLQQSYKMYSDLTNAGMNFNGNLSVMRKAAADSGMTLEQFSKSVTTSNAMFRTLGYEQVSRFNRSIVDASNNMAGLALTVEQRQEYENDYINVLSSQGRIQSATTEDVTNGFIDLVKQSKGLSSVFGESADSIAKKASDFLNSKEGYSNVTALMENQNNSQLFTMISQSIGKQLQISDSRMQEIMNYAATGHASPALIHDMADSAYRNIVQQISAPLRRIANSNRTMSANEVMPELQNSYRNISNTRSYFDLTPRNWRGVMNANPNDRWNQDIEASNMARLASNAGNNMVQNFQQAQQSADHPDTALQAAHLQYRIDSTDITRLNESIQSAIIAGSKNTMLESERLFDHSLNAASSKFNDFADTYKENNISVDKLTAAIVKLTDNGIGHTLIGGAAVVGELAAPIIAALAGHGLTSLGIGALLRTVNRNDRGGLSKGLRHLRSGIGRATTNTGGIGSRVRSLFSRNKPVENENGSTSRPVNDNSQVGEGLSALEKQGSNTSRLRGSLSAGRNALGRRMLGGSMLGSLAFGTYDELNDLSDYRKGNITGDQLKENTYKNAGGTIGSGLGAWGGAAGGAALGTMILPGIGTVIGGLAGGLFGGMAGQSVGQNIGDDGYHIMNPNASKVRPVSKPVMNKDSQPTMTDLDYLKNIDKNVDAIKSIINPNDVSSISSSSDNNSDTNTVDNPFGDSDSDITNDFSDQKATNKSEADLDSILEGINDMVNLLNSMVDNNQQILTETSTQNHMVYTLLNRLNTNISKQNNKQPGIL